MVKIEEIVLIIVFLIAVVTGLWYLFGDSPTLEQGLIIFLLSSVMGIVINLVKLGTRVEYFERNARDGFNNIKSDLGLIKNKLKI